MPHLVESAKHKRPDVAENLVDFDVSLRERYVSKLRPLIKAEAKKNKYGHKTFGEAEVRVRKPKEFLRKNTRITPPKPEVDQCHGKGIGKPVPSVPKHLVPKAPVVQEKNFRADNVVTAMRSRARQPVPRYVLTRRGDTRLLEPSGTVPRYALKKGYGKVPKYLQKRLKDCQKQQKVEEEGKDPAETATRALSEAERTELIEGLKKNWEEAETAYQKLPLIIETPSMLRRKIMLEKKLTQLENDITFLEKHEHIYIYDDENSS
ncbi:enkurin [Schistocerca piceifrons]|uniref:enkurin n=1 Tax=Schistocerca piceifrons TaxID=274613 RepID=UPI001F5E837D|nr:enkurin [Schistocerca piceifrons]